MNWMTLKGRKTHNHHAPISSWLTISEGYRLRVQMVVTKSV